MKKQTHFNKLCWSKIPVFLSRLTQLRFRFVRPFSNSVESIFVKQSRWTICTTLESINVKRQQLSLSTLLLSSLSSLSSSSLSSSSSSSSLS